MGLRRLGRGHTAALAIAPVRDDHLAGLPPLACQVFPTPPVRDTYLGHPAGSEVVGERQPPGVACPPRVVETAGIDHQKAPGWLRHRGRRRRGNGAQCAQEPQQPVVTGAQALAPGGLRDVGKADQYRPRPKAAGRQRSEHIRQQTAQQVVVGWRCPGRAGTLSAPEPARPGGLARVAPRRPSRRLRPGRALVALQEGHVCSLGTSMGGSLRGS